LTAEEKEIISGMKSILQTDALTVVAKVIRTKKKFGYNIEIKV
jgi:hypothetical protein